MINGNFRMFALVVTGFLVLVPATAGLAVIISGLHCWFRAQRLARAGERAVATVVDNQVEPLSEGTTHFLPVVRFTTRTGREVRTVLTDQRGNRSHPAGAQHTVAFDPDRPDTAIATVGAGTGAVGAVILGAVLLLFAGGVLFMVNRFFPPPGGAL
ncbi:DUF3592 domain-containing protein [Actinoplanes siamensis]|nr:DUF3592 domain-containing protein [Actinoplanes siamensis]